jgi:hypothetical protein
MESSAKERIRASRERRAARDAAAREAAARGAAAREPAGQLPEQGASAYYVILDSTGNLVDSFDRENEARSALDDIVRQDPDSADEYALLVYDEDGHPTGAALSGSHLGVRA